MSHKRFVLPLNSLARVTRRVAGAHRVDAVCEGGRCRRRGPACTGGCGDLLELVGLQKRVDFHVIFLEAGANVIEGFIDAVGELEHLVFLFADGPPVDHGLPVEDFVPIFAAVDEDDVVFGKLAGLQEGEHLPKFVHGAEAAGKNDEGFGDLREPEFAHEEIMEIEAELGADVGVGELFVGQFDREADRFAAGFAGAIMPGPPPEQMTKRRGLGPRVSDQVVILWASSRASS